MSKLEVDKIDPQSGTALEIGSSGDTITIPSGATLDASNATTTLPANVVTTDGTQTLTNKSIAATQLTGTITPSDGTVTNAKIVDSTIELAKLSATGTKDATTFLRGDNTFAEAGGGKILQVIADDSDSATATTSTSYVATALSVNITPSATSSKILVMATSIIDSEGTGVVPRVTLYRDTTELQNGLALNYSSAGRVITPVTLIKLDSPSSTSQLNYKVYLKSSDGSNVSFNSDSGMRGQIVVIEVGA